MEAGPPARAVVCGIDGSDESLAAALVATRLARSLGLRVILAHAVESLDAAEMSAEGGSLLDRVELPLRGLGVERRVVRGDPAEQLAALALEEDAALVSVASTAREAGRAAERGLGEMSERLQEAEAAAGRPSGNSAEEALDRTRQLAQPSRLGRGRAARAAARGRPDELMQDVHVSLE
jgi:nucleotide-binding universal stress UspA family protein